MSGAVATPANRSERLNARVALGCRQPGARDCHCACSTVCAGAHATGSTKRWEEPQLAELIKSREEEGLAHWRIAERMGVTKGQDDRQVLLLIYDQRLKERTGKAPEASATDSAPREWADVRREAKALYEKGDLDHDEMAVRLNLTRTQLQTPLSRLLRDRQLAPRPRARKKIRT